MAPVIEFQQEIENEMAALAAADLRKAGCSGSRFTDIFGNILAQAGKDREYLVNAGMPAAKLDRYNACLVMLTYIYGTRHGATCNTERNAYFREQMTQAIVDRKRLSVVAQHLLKSCTDNTIIKNIQRQSSSSSITAVLNANIAYVAFIKEHPKRASEIRPGGVTIDQAFLTAAHNRAADLLALKEMVVKKGTQPLSEVDSLNRIVTLCRNAMTDIKKFASAAFIDDISYLKKHYRITTARSRRTKTPA